MSNDVKINDMSSTENSNDYHIPVLLNETIEGLNIKPDGIYVDCTFGGGGHSRTILNMLGPDGKLFVFDQDEAARRNLPDDNRVVFIQKNFRHIKKFLRLNKCAAVDGILADLGVSSHQFDEAERGFSIRFDAEMDMRMDQRQSKTASQIVETYSETELQKIFEKYGEVTNARTLARSIVAKRNSVPMKKTDQFKQAIKDEVKGNPNKYFAQVFQALRIEVNEEMDALIEMLDQAYDLLKSGGRLAVITFHSLEDRIVKNFIKTGSVTEVKADDVYGTKPQNLLKAVNKKPVEASFEELRKNSRSRSAKLRIAEKK